MKRVPPVIGCAVLEEEDIKQMSERDKRRLLIVYTWVLTTSVLLIGWGIIEAI